MATAIVVGVVDLCGTERREDAVFITASLIEARLVQPNPKSERQI
jgi:hypothetical protein